MYVCIYVRIYVSTYVRMYVCMHIYYVKYQKKAKQVRCLKIAKIQKQKMVANKQQSTPCIASQVNQTRDRNDKANDNSTAASQDAETGCKQ